MGIHWVTPPEKIIDGLDAYHKKAMVAIHAVATRWGQDVQNQARANAPWQDRTANARTGIFFVVDGFGLPPIVGEMSESAMMYMSDVVAISGDAENLVVAVGHTVFYGKFLEVSGKWAIIMSTIQGNLKNLNAQLQQLFAG